MATLYTIRPTGNFRTTRPMWSSSLNDPFFNQAFNLVFGPTKTSSQSPSRTKEATYNFQMNVAQDENNYYIYAVLPGVNPEDLEISALENKLTIAGHIEPAGFGPQTSTKEEVEAKEGEDKAESKDNAPKLKWLLAELSQNTLRFHRELTLPANINPDGVQAFYDNGILRLVVPQIPEVQPRRITVSSVASKNELAEGTSK